MGYPTFSVTLAALAAVGFLSRVDGPARNGSVANTSSTRECRPWQRRELFGGGPPSLPTSGFSCPSAYYPSNFYTSVEVMLILIASCFDSLLFVRFHDKFLAIILTTPPDLPLSARVTI